MNITLDPIACDGHGVCAELLPELIEVDDWGYPIVRDHEVPPHLEAMARRVRDLCPKLAVRLSR